MSKITVIRQVDRTDCGPACLATVLNYWSRREPLYRLRELAGTTQSGTSMYGLIQACRRLNLEAEPYHAEVEDLKELSLPAILHWEHNHYVVLFSITPREATIADPGAGLRRIKLDELREKWTGNVLAVQPLAQFEKGNFIGKRGLSALLSHLSHFRGTTGVMIEILLATIVLSLFSLISPLLSQVVFDRVLTFGERQLLPAMLWAILGFAVFQTLVSMVRSYLSNYLGMALNYRMQYGYLDHLMRLPLRVHETRLVGDLLQRNGDLNTIRSVLTSLMISAPVAALTLVFSVSLLMMYNIKLALVASLSLILDIIYVTFISPKLRANSRVVLSKSGQLSSFLIGNLEGISALKAFNGESWAISRGRNQISGLLDQSWQGVMLNNTAGGVFGLLGSVGSLLTLWYGATQVLDAKLSVGQLVATYGLTNNAMGALSSLINMVQSVQQGVVASDRLAEILELPTETHNPNQPPMPPLQRALNTEHLRFGYLPDQPILKDVNLTLPVGSYTALLGSNGSGKTTLCNILTAMLDQTSGQVYWDGRPLREYQTNAIRNRVAYQRQDVPLFYATFRENLTLGRDLPQEQIIRITAQLQLDPIIRRLPEGLDTMLGGDSPHRLSSGERQMLGMARVLLTDADVLILDEPTATLDLDRETLIVHLLKQLKGRRTILVITHRPALLEPADQILELRGGQLNERRKA